MVRFHPADGRFDDMLSPGCCIGTSSMLMMSRSIRPEQQGSVLGMVNYRYKNVSQGNVSRVAAELTSSDVRNIFDDASGE